MTNLDIVKYRLFNQQISQTKFKTPGELVSYFIALQAQNYNSAKWAIGSRLPGITDVDVEKSLTDKKIIRTWLMRCTLHIVAVEDIRWLLTLLSPGIISKTAARIRQLGIDDSDIKKSNKVLIKALKNGDELTRDELAPMLHSAGVNTDGLRLSHLLQRASLEQIICFGSKRGNQFTFTLLDSFVPDVNPLERENALAEFTRRYFLSRGPATFQDFVWWSGLSVRDARTGIEYATQWLIKENINGNTYWLNKDKPNFRVSKNSTCLLAAFDEYLISYKNRSSCLDYKFAGHVFTKNGIFNPIILENGCVVGTWKPVIAKNKIVIKTHIFNSLNKNQNHFIDNESKKYAAFINKSLG
jgi:hypothetical protein